MHQIKTAVPTHHRTGQSLKGHNSGGWNTLFQDWEAQVRKKLHSPQCFLWFIKHHLHCCTNNSTLPGDGLGWNKPSAKPGAGLPAAMLRARPVRSHCPKEAAHSAPRRHLIWNLTSLVLFFNLAVSQISSERSAFKELSSKGTARGSLWLTTLLWRAPEQTSAESMATVSQREGVTDPRQWHQCLPSAHSLLLQIPSSILKWNFRIGICAAKLSQFSLQCFT